MDRNETTSEVELGRTGMVVAHEQRELCIPVDEVVGTQQTVVKSLPEYTGTVPGVAGMSIMADGKVTFILDVRALAQRILA
jgi:two-component system chemotaxis sensor kinase CheA